MRRFDHIMHRGARRVQRDDQTMRGIGAALALCAPETTTAHCHHGHEVQVAPPPQFHGREEWIIPRHREGE